MDADRQQIVELMAQWRQASAAGDLDAVLALMTADAVFLTAGNPPMSKADFATAFRGLAAHMHIEAEQDVREVLVDGDLACAWTALSVTMVGPDGNRSPTRRGHTLTVFRRGDDGRWRLARDANLLAPPSDA